ncbi:pPIWI_RE module domain-containing protein [Streptomyces sp. NPDC006692]|uniref:pPIWI_RE module domain-containing protein n=1 Tax=Streptomyces sp. NPDC006692 TaxID=3364758 RepID=UPI0036C00A0C
MAYDHIQTAAFVPDPTAGPFFTQYHALSFPTSWRDPLLRFYRHGKTEQAQKKIKEVPINRLNTVMRTLAPDLVTVAKNASFEASQPWVYAHEPFPKSVLDNFVNAWLRDMQPVMDAETYALFRDTVRELDTRSLEWQLVGVDMLQHSLSNGGTAVPAGHLYRLLAETFAERIVQLGPYEHGGERVSFRLIAGQAGGNGAELISWPPLEHEAKKRTWHYSAIIRVSLRTVPFSAVPRIHIGTGIRRWVNGKVWMPMKGGVSTYLMSNSSLIPNGPTPSRFAVAQLTTKDRTVVWQYGGPEQMLRLLSAADNLPSPEVLAKEPEVWLPGRDGIAAAVAFHTMMVPTHEVGPGLMPSERRRLVEWLAPALEPEFKLAAPLRISSIKSRNPLRVLEPHRSVPTEKKDATEEEIAELTTRRAEIEAVNSEIDARNAERRRVLLAAVTEGQDLSVVLLFQSEAIRNHIIAAAEASLDLSDHRFVQGPDTWVWQAPELTLRIHTRPLGQLGAPLGDGDGVPRRGRKLEEAVEERRAAVAQRLAVLTTELSDGPRLSLIELDGEKRFRKRATDPKSVIRLGCADAGLVSQFIRPLDTAAKKPEEDAAHRARAAWADGLRQLGMRFVPPHSLGAEAIPEQLNQLAFRLVRRRRGDGPIQGGQFTPVAVLIRPGLSCIMGRTPDTNGWVPYPELLRGLTGQLRPEELKTEEQQKAAAGTFVKNTLYGLRGEPTLVVVEAQNIRDRWLWMQNGELVRDRLNFGGESLQRLALLGKKLRVARVADSAGERDETPEWWAPKPNQRGGISKGLWVPEGGEADNRVFFSTTDNPQTQTISRDLAKLTPHTNAAGKPALRPDKNAWNPELLEFTMAAMQPGDAPETWAMYLHQQRFCDDYPDGLGLPLILHLARLTMDYALPHEAPEQADTSAEQLAFDLFGDNGSSTSPSE